MSIGRRLFDFARSELNSLLDRAGDGSSSSSSRRDDDDRDPDRDLYERYSLDAISDAELEAELDRRRRAREAAARAAASRASTGARTSAGGARPSPGPRPSAGPRPEPPRPSAPVDEIRRAYAALEVPYGSDFEAVRRAYRAMMRKYHPDRHTQSPEKQKAANELAQKITDAYKKLEKHLRK